MMGATHTYWGKMVKHGLVQNIVFEHAIFPFCAWFILLPLYLRPKRTTFSLQDNAAVMGELYFAIQIFIQVRFFVPFLCRFCAVMYCLLC